MHKLNIAVVSLLAVSLIGLTLLPSASAEEAKKSAAEEAAAWRESRTKPHTDEQLKGINERFKNDFKSEDMDARLRILNWYGQHRHKSVLKVLKKIWLKEKNVELQGAAAARLAEQVPWAKDASRALMTGIDKYIKYATADDLDEEKELQNELEARALANAVRSLGLLGVKPDKKGWKTIKGLIDHNNDEVAIAMLNWCGMTKEWRALKVILPWFEFYPDGYSWSGGSVKVDTGAAGNKDAKAAKAKFHAKYGGRAKKSRPAAHAAMKQALLDITGLKFEKPAELKAWMKENKQLLKKNGV